MRASECGAASPLQIETFFHFNDVVVVVVVIDGGGIVVVFVGQEVIGVHDNGMVAC